MVNIGELGVGLKLENGSIEKLTRDIQNQIKQGGDIAGEKLGKGIEKGLDQKQATNELAKGIEQKVGNAGEKAGNKLQQSLGGGLKALVGLGVTRALSTAAGRAYTLAGNLQQADVAFTTMLGGAEAARKMLQDLSDFAANTPFELTGVRQTAKQLLAYGIEAHKIIPTLKALGDVSAGLSVPIEQVAYAYGQVKSAGRLVGNDLKQFINAGVPIIQELAKNMGVAESKIKDMVSAGKIGFADVEKAFQTMSSEGGKFANLMEKQSDTMMGAWSNLKDSIDSLGEAIGSLFTSEAGGIFKWMSDMVGGIKTLVQEYPELTKTIVTFIGVAGGLIGILTTLAGTFGIISLALGSATLPILAVVGAVAVLTTSRFSLQNAIQSTATYMKDAGKSYSDLEAEIQANIQSQKELRESYDAGSISASEYKTKMEELQKESQRLQKAQERTTMSFEETREAINGVNNSKLNNKEKLQRLLEIQKQANFTRKSVLQLKSELASLSRTTSNIKELNAGKLNRGSFKAHMTKSVYDFGATFGWSKSGDIWANEQLAKQKTIEDQIANYEELAKQEAELQKTIDNLNKEIEKGNLSGGGGAGGASGASKKVDHLKESMDKLKKSYDEAMKADETYAKVAEKTAESTRKYYEKLGDEIRNLENKYKNLISEFEKGQQNDKESFLRSQVEKAESLSQQLLTAKSSLIDLRNQTINKEDSKLGSNDLSLLESTDLLETQRELKNIQEELSRATTEYDRERLKEKLALIQALKEQLEIESNLKAVNESISGLGLDQSLIDQEKTRAGLSSEQRAIADRNSQQAKKKAEFEAKKKQMEEELEIYKFFENQKFLSSAEVQRLMTAEALQGYSQQEQELILKLARERLELEKQKEEKIAMEEAVHVKMNQLSNDATNTQIKNMGKLKAEYRTLIAQIETAINRQRQLGAGKISGKGYSIGGYTGSGGNLEVAGVVHKNERVAPAWMTSKFADTFNQLEKIRMRGFASGGFTSDNSRHIEQNNTINVQNVFDVEEFLDKQRRKMR